MTYSAKHAHAERLRQLQTRQLGKPEKPISPYRSAKSRFIWLGDYSKVGTTRSHFEHDRETP